MVQPSASAPNVVFNPAEQTLPQLKASPTHLHREKLTYSRIAEAVGRIFLSFLLNLAYLVINLAYPVTGFSWKRGREIAKKEYSQGVDLFHLKLKAKRMPSVSRVGETEDPRSKQTSAPSLLHWNSEGNKVKTGPELSSKESVDPMDSESHTPSGDDLRDSSFSSSDKMKEEDVGIHVEKEEESQEESPDPSLLTPTEISLPPSEDPDLSTDSEELVLSHDNIREFLDDTLRWAVSEMDEDPKLPFDIEKATPWNKIDGKYFHPSLARTLDEIGSFCINPFEKDAMVPFQGRVKFRLANETEHRVQFYCLSPNRLKKSDPKKFTQEQTKRMGNYIANSLKAFSPDGFTDLAIYSALNKLLSSLQESSCDPEEFSTDIVIVLNQKLWVAHLGSGAVFLGNKEKAIPLTLEEFSIVDYPLEKIQPACRLFLINSDIKNVASIQEIAKAEHDANSGFNGKNNGSVVRQIACTAHAQGASKPAALVAHISGTQKPTVTQKVTPSEPRALKTLAGRLKEDERN